MAKKKKIDDALLDSVQQHHADAKAWLGDRREEWDELEAMLIVHNQESLGTKSKVFDPKLSTTVYERSARVMGQNPTGKAYATSKDDIGKTLLMNLLLDYYAKRANEQRRFVTKLRMMDLYSHVYGSMFAIVPWRVDKKREYVGPELNLLPIRNAFPQPGVSLADADWFQARDVVSVSWLEARKEEAPDVWNVEDLIDELKHSGGDKQNNEEDTTSLIDRELFPTVVSDAEFPKVEIIHEYRRDKWITWTPMRADSKTSRPYVLRMVEDPYPDYMLPVISKDALPLMNCPIGIGEFAKGKSLQYAINSLINMYMEGVKFSIFPPLHMNPDNVVKSSIKWGAGNFWFMDNPNVDIQPMNVNPRGLDTFQSTYSFLSNALTNQSGSSEVMTAKNSDFSLGKTPKAIENRLFNQQARDEWDLFMMDETLQDLYDRWIGLIVQKQEKNVKMRLFAEEIEDIQETYPDVVEMFDSGKRGSVSVKKGSLDTKYDFVLEPGSTYRVAPEEEQEKITSVLKSVLENPGIGEMLAANDQELNMGELFKRWLKSNIRDWDKIIVDKKPETPEVEALPEEEMPMEQMPPQMPQQPAAPQVGMDISDPQLQQLVQEVLGGTGGVPYAG
jgi:hypothetical protein